MTSPTASPATPVHHDRHGQAIDLAEVLALHRQWRVLGNTEGVRADLHNADLRNADLDDADLGGANLGGAYLRGAYLRGADLRNADLRGAYLRGADLSNADLRGANLGGAYLDDANLGGAYLRGAYLRGAKNILQVGPCDDWIMTAVAWDDGPRIHAGCRWFTVAEARAHWDGSSRKNHDEKMMAGVDALLALGRLNGWQGCE